MCHIVLWCYHASIWSPELFPKCLPSEAFPDKRLISNVSFSIVGLTGSHWKAKYCNILLCTFFWRGQSDSIFSITGNHAWVGHTGTIMMSLETSSHCTFFRTFIIKLKWGNAYGKLNVCQVKDKACTAIAFGLGFYKTNFPTCRFKREANKSTLDAPYSVWIFWKSDLFSAHSVWSSNRRECLSDSVFSTPGMWFAVGTILRWKHQRHICLVILLHWGGY